MAGKRKRYYSQEIMELKKKYYKGIPEKQRRHFLGLEYLELGKGSQRYLSEVFKCSRDTIIRGKKEVSAKDFKPDYSRQRKPGGGPKKKKNEKKA